MDIRLLNSPRFAWSLGGSFYYNHNEVTDMGGVADFNVGGQKRVTKGQPIGAWWMATPIDTNDDGLLDGSENRFTGTFPVPNKSGGASTRRSRSGVT